MPSEIRSANLGRALRAPLFLALPALLVQLAPGAAERLEYDRDRLAAGELWRLATCHFAHWSPEHLGWDLGAVVALAACCARFGVRRLAAALGVAALTVPLAVWIVLPSMPRYRGLSGLASTLFALLAVAVLREGRAGGRAALAFAAAAFLAGFVAKLVWEMATASPVFVGPGSGFVAVPLAHLVGAVCGACFAPSQREGVMAIGPGCRGRRSKRRRRSSAPRAELSPPSCSCCECRCSRHARHGKRSERL